MSIWQSVQTIGGTIVKALIDIIKSYERPRLFMAVCIDRRQNSYQIKSYDSLADSLVAPARTSYIENNSWRVSVKFHARRWAGRYLLGIAPVSPPLEGPVGVAALLCCASNEPITEVTGATPSSEI